MDLDHGVLYTLQLEQEQYNIRQRFINAPIYYEVELISTTGLGDGANFSAGMAVFNDGNFDRSTDYSVAILIILNGAQAGYVVMESFESGATQLEMGGAPTSDGTVLGVWIDVNNNVINYTYDGVLKTTDPGGTNPAPVQNFQTPNSVTNSNLFSGSGTVAGNTGNSIMSIKINVGQDPFKWDPTLMPGSVDWFGNVL